MRTTINWRPYPEQKPVNKTDSMYKSYPVIDKGVPGSAFFGNKTGFRAGVTHFALPEDIVTEES